MKHDNRLPWQGAMSPVHAVAFIYVYVHTNVFESVKLVLWEYETH